MPKETKEQIPAYDDYTHEDESAGLILVELHPRMLNVEGKKGASRIFHEFDPNHPNEGEALVVAGRVVKVYPTSRVRKAIAEGILRQTSKPPTQTLNMSDLIDGLQLPGDKKVAAAPAATPTPVVPAAPADDQPATDTPDDEGGEDLARTDETPGESTGKPAKK